MRDLFRQLAYATDVKAVVIHGAGDNFCSGGDVHDIIAPLIDLPMPELLLFTRMTGDLVKAMRHCPQPVIAAVDGVCAGAGAILAMASDMRLGTARSKLAFLFSRVGLAGCDMGACSILPRIIGQGRAAELLFTGRSASGDEGYAWGFYNRLCEPAALLDEAQTARRRSRRWPDLRARHHEEDAASGMEHEHRRSDRIRSAGAGDLHEHARFRARLSARSPRSRGPCSKETEMSATATDLHSALAWPFFEPNVIANWRAVSMHGAARI